MAENVLQIDTASIVSETISANQGATPDTSGKSVAGSPRPCIFFAQGFCKHGEACRFSHDVQLQVYIHLVGHTLVAIWPIGAWISKERTAANLAPLPPPVFVNIPPGHAVFSIDVECVATGVQHNSRSIAQVALGKYRSNLQLCSFLLILCLMLPQLMNGGAWFITPILSKTNQLCLT